jgi:hypothetical protein
MRRAFADFIALIARMIPIGSAKLDADRMGRVYGSKFRCLPASMDAAVDDESQ